jgi:hypothetical protein
MYAINSGVCQPPFASVFFKSRSSHSFTSNLQDFAGPYDFLQPALDYTISAPTLTCSNPTGSIAIQNSTTNYITWSTSNGNITSTAATSAVVNKPGTYTVQTSLAQGCPVLRTDVITIVTDTFAPIASFYSTTTSNPNQFILHGGDTAASNYSTPFGNSQGLLWNWSGPGGFSSTVQNPQTTYITGTYQLIVTEKRNGCTDTVTNDFNMVVLSSDLVPKSNIVKKSKDDALSCKLAGNYLSATPRLIINTKETSTTKVIVFNTAGQTTYSKQLVLTAGQNNIDLPANGVKDRFQVVAVYINNRLQFSGKLVF